MAAANSEAQSLRESLGVRAAYILWIVRGFSTPIFRTWVQKSTLLLRNRGLGHAEVLKKTPSSAKYVTRVPPPPPLWEKSEREEAGMGGDCAKNCQCSWYYPRHSPSQGFNPWLTLRAAKTGLMILEFLLLTKALFCKRFKREMLIVRQTTTHPQLFCDLMHYSQVIY